MDMWPLLWLWLWSATVTSQEESHVVKRAVNWNKRLYKPRYHISAPFSWLNHPSGFTWFGRQIHIFYQFHPYHSFWGHMSWGHVSTKNFIDWERYPIALSPTDPYDGHGCLSGTATVYNRQLTLFYTGNAEMDGRQTQNIAVSRDGYKFKKYLYNPIVRSPPTFVKKFRNPKVWRFRNTWYMIIGTTSVHGNGQLLLYTSTDVYNWKFNKTLVDSYGDVGKVWESPDLLQLDGASVLILSVIGMESDGDYRFMNLYQNGYVVTSFDYKKASFRDIEVSTATFHELDYGHDFYAARTLSVPDGRTLLVAWLGMWGNDYREAKNGWAGMLTLVREIRLSHKGRILMEPVREMANLRMGVMEDAWYSPGQMFYAETKSFELVINSTGSLDMVLEFEWGEHYGYKIGYSARHRTLTVDNGDENGVRRTGWLPGEQVYMRIFVDTSSIETFCGEGDVVFSSRIYPTRMMFVKIGGESNVHIIQYRLRRSTFYKNTFPHSFNTDTKYDAK